MRKRLGLGTLILYTATGLSAVLIASLLSSQFMTKAFSQAPIQQPIIQPNVVPTNQNPSNPNFQGGAADVPVIVNPTNPPPPMAPASNIFPNPAPVPQGPGVPQVGSQVLTVVPSGKGKAKITQGEASAESKIPDLLVGIIEDYNYNPNGKRDPFTPFEKSGSTNQVGPIWPLQKYDLEQLKLVGIIWEVKIPKAMILDPSGHSYMATVNERIGRNNGYIARIREGEIVVVENTVGIDGKPTYVTKLMKLRPQ